MIAWFRYICLIVSLIITMPELLSAQRLVSQRQEDVEAGLLYNESVYILSNYSCLSSNSPEKLSLDELLRKQIEGFYFYLKRDTETNVLLLRKPDGTFTPFSESLEAIKTALDADSTKVMTLFLDFYVETELESSFKEIGLMEYVLEYDTKNGWPSLKDMLSSGKRLVVFEVQKHLNSPSWLHNMRDFVEHTDADWGNQPEGVESFDERLKKNLSLFTGYKFLETSRGNSNDISALARQTPYLIESFKRAWIRDGRVPNFILVDKYYAWLDVSLVTFRNFDIIYGAVTNNNELLNYVNWDGMSNYTTGKYCFPLEPGAELMLSPISPGYRIEPATVVVSGISYLSYLLKRYVFHESGVLVSGIIGGLYSSTATISVLARKSRKASEQEANEYVAAMLLAVSMMFLRFMILILIFSREIFTSIYPYLLIMSVVAAVVAWFIHSRHRRSKDMADESEDEDSSNPLEFKVALIFATLFVVFTVLTHYTLVYAGTGGLNLLSFVSGLSDITPFILNLLQNTGSVAVLVVVACSMQAIISNILVNMFYALFFAGKGSKLRPWILGGFGTVIGVNLVLLLFFYL